MFGVLYASKNCRTFTWPKAFFDMETPHRFLLELKSVKPERTYSVSQAARYLGVHRCTIYAYLSLAEKPLPFIKTQDSKKKLFRGVDLITFKSAGLPKRGRKRRNWRRKKTLPQTTMLQIEKKASDRIIFPFREVWIDGSLKKHSPAILHKKADQSEEPLNEAERNLAVHLFGLLFACVSYLQCISAKLILWRRLCVSWPLHFPLNCQITSDFAWNTKGRQQRTEATWVMCFYKISDSILCILHNAIEKLCVCIFVLMFLTRAKLRITNDFHERVCFDNLWQPLTISENPKISYPIFDNLCHIS